LVLIPVQFAENQMESVEILAKIATKIPKDAVLRKPYLIWSGKQVSRGGIISANAVRKNNKTPLLPKKQIWTMFLTIRGAPRALDCY
jgi:hypothetical protein